MLNDKIILVTGGTGSFGRAFVERVCKDYKFPRKLIIFSRDEFKQSQMQPECQAECMRWLIGDTRDLTRLRRAFTHVDYVIHAAALKQVPALEYNPTEAIKTNISGAVNVIEAALDCGVAKVVNISTDKAVNPINLYGATKLCAEKLFTAANSYAKTCFCSVRYGNVIGSRGSIIPKLLETRQQRGLTLNITSREMTRFWLTLEQAINMVLFALEEMQGGEIFVPKTPSMKVLDLFRAIVPNAAISEGGLRPGEKLHETLITEGDENVVFVDPDHNRILPRPERYTSDGNDMWLTKKDIQKFLCLDSGSEESYGGTY